MPLSAQLAKLLTKGAQKLMSSGPGAIMKHEPTMRVLTPEQEAASYAPIRTSSYGLLPEEQVPITPVETPIAEMGEGPVVLSQEANDLITDKGIDNEYNEVVSWFANEWRDGAIGSYFTEQQLDKGAHYDEATTMINQDPAFAIAEYKNVNAPQRSALRQQVEDLNLSKEETDVVLPIRAETDELAPSAKEVKLKKGKTREEVELQGGPLSSKLNEQEIGRLLDEHNIEWEYNDNGGITAIEEFSKGPSRKKYFKRNTSLKTIRDWLGYSKGGVVDMRNGGRVSMVHGGSAGVETEEAREARLQATEARQEASEQLSETEKAVAVTREGTTEPIKYMYDYGKRREGRLSQGPKGRELRKGSLGYFRPEGKTIYVTPRVDVESPRGESKPGREHRGNVPEGSSSLPFVGETKYPERKSTIATEQHEFTHAFIDFLDYAARDKKILSTLSKQDQIKLFKFMDFRQKEEFGPRNPAKTVRGGYRIEHKLMDQPTDTRTTYFKPGTGASVGDFLSERKGLGTKPESYFTEKIIDPRKDDPSGAADIGRAGTISELAKVFLKAAAKNPEIHKRALKKWTKSEKFFRRPTTEFDEAIKQLQGEEEEQQLQQVQEQYGQKNGGRVGAAVVAASLMASGGQAVDMRNGGVVGMEQGGPIIDFVTPEEKEFDKDYDAYAEVSKQMEALLAKRQAAVDYGGFEQPAPPPVPKMNPLRTKQREIKERVMASTLKEIADAEGTGDQGYNIVFGTPSGGSSSIFINPTTELTSMTLKELDTFQRNLINATRDKVKGVKPGHGTSAVGKYQVTLGALDTARKRLGYSDEDWGELKYTPELQEQIGRALLEYRGFDKMMNGEWTPEKYREKLHNEWASIPGKIKKVGEQPTPANVGRIEDGFRNAINELKVSRDTIVN